MKEKKKKIIKKLMPYMMIIGAFLVTSIMLTVNYQEIIEHPWDIRSWHHNVLAENNPGTGASGILEVYIYPHQSNPTSAYATNLSTANAYAYGDPSGSSNIGSDVPYDTKFDIVVKVRWNTTHAYNSSSSQWVLDWVRGNLTCSDLDGSPNDVAMGEVEITHNDNYIWVNYYLQDADGGTGNGFDINRGETVNNVQIRFDAYF